MHSRNLNGWLLICSLISAQKKTWVACHASSSFTSSFTLTNFNLHQFTNVNVLSWQASSPSLFTLNIPSVTNWRLPLTPLNRCWFARDNGSKSLQWVVSLQLNWTDHCYRCILKLMSVTDTLKNHCPLPMVMSFCQSDQIFRLLDSSTVIPANPAGKILKNWVKLYFLASLMREF